jgi:hypothetical protein
MTGALADTLADHVAGFLRLFCGIGALSIMEVR